MEKRCPSCGYPLLTHQAPYQCANPGSTHYSREGKYGLEPCEAPAVAVKPEPRYVAELAADEPQHDLAAPELTVEVDRVRQDQKRRK